jgi:outer membrane protein OmpA-like peptidoglycan-associated protein
MTSSNSIVRILVAVVLLALPVALPLVWISQAQARLSQNETMTKADAPDQAAVAAATDAGYCNPELKRVLRRVLQSCGLVGRDGQRGCQPLSAKAVATLSGPDFNALFKPMRERGGIIQFEAEQAELDAADKTLADQIFSDQRGASYFLVVARASPDGDQIFNRELSKRRAEGVLQHLQTSFPDPDLEQEVGLLWLGEEYAQLEQEFCEWRRSNAGEICDATTINRGAFLAWIDCRL